MPVSPRWRGALLAGFVAYLGLLAVVLLGPSTRPGDRGIELGVRVLLRVGVPDALVTPERVEALLNVALLAPLSAFGLLLWPGSNWRDWTAYGFVVALVAETWQGLVFAARTATFSDVVANTAGALVGAVVVSALRLALRPGSARRDQAHDL